ncbi:hypothetical protein CMEL01_04467 [Colletotrichum melonis]|uniref:FAD-binding domain-containing protein n=1 Tax=Colletotrichum melonis TaxID=1209925 RepID=A0AAI9XMA8_9PEZI|nr:hypothetical protein CMEL01_04467 [Colletotrichum melonis]
MGGEKKPFEIAIIGGGIAGIILAISLAKRNVPCIIYEKAHAYTELGVGLGVSPNALRAMITCDPVILEALESVAEPPFRWEVFDGTDEANEDTVLFTLGNSTTGLRGCHRGQFLTHLLKHVPGDTIHYSKELESIEGPEETGKRLRMIFRDGSTAEADGIIGCDGIKSHTRGIVIGHDHAATKCTYTHKYTYRGLIPMSQAVQILGPDRARTSGLWVCNDAHIVTYPVAHGKMLNLVAHTSTTEEWPSETQFTLPATVDDCIKDLKAFSPRMQKAIRLLKVLDRWALFDLGDGSVPTFAKGRICLLGDAAHASTPHQGAGAGICVEDAAVMASLLADQKVRDSTAIEAAFAAFDASRRERGQWLIRESRRAGELYDLRTEHGKDFDKLREEIFSQADELWNFDLDRNIRDALEDMRRRLAAE